MDEIEGYVLGAVGILILGASLSLQVVALANSRPWMALLFTVGVIAGGFLYRAGFRLASR